MKKGERQDGRREERNGERGGRRGRRRAEERERKQSWVVEEHKEERMRGKEVRRLSRRLSCTVSRNGHCFLPRTTWVSLPIALVYSVVLDISFNTFKQPFFHIDIMGHDL